MKTIGVIAHQDSAHHIKSILAPLDAEFVYFDSEDRIQSLATGGGPISCIIFDEDYFSYDEDLRLRIFKVLEALNKDFIVVSSRKDPVAIRQAIGLGAQGFISKPYNKREFITYVNAVLMKKTRIVCLGGGTGLFTLLSGIKNIENTFLTSIVSMADDGGSSGRLRSSFGILPPGDVRRSLIALSNAPELMNHVMQHRFSRGHDLSGHNVGNLILTALTDIKGSMSEAVKALGDIMNVQGHVIPITSTHTQLCAKFEDGRVVKGESQISLCEGRSPDLKIVGLWHDPEPQCDLDAYAAILAADLVIMGPGDLFTSVLANLIIPSIREVIAETPAKKLYISNLMTKPGETSGYDAAKHVNEIVSNLGADLLDYVLLSKTKFSDKAKQEYAHQNQFPVAVNCDDISRITNANLVLADIGDVNELVRHNSEKLCEEIEKIIREFQLSRLSDVGLHIL